MQGAVDLPEARIAGVQERNQRQQLLPILRVGEGLRLQRFGRALGRYRSRRLPVPVQRRPVDDPRD